jgi:short-subunit dehydrogenase
MSFLFAKDGIGLVITARNENALMDLQKEINSQYPAVPVTIISCDLSETGADGNGNSGVFGIDFFL